MPFLVSSRPDRPPPLGIRAPDRGRYSHVYGGGREGDLVCFGVSGLTRVVKFEGYTRDEGCSAEWFRELSGFGFLNCIPQRL